MYDQWSCKCHRWELYIPLWLYSNADLDLKYMTVSDLYIPLWLYSNVVIVRVQSDAESFTFHYGYILIRI